MAKVYIAGPMRGYPELNFPAFDKAAALGRSLGWEVLSPADMDRNAGFDEKEDASPIFNPEKIREFIRRDSDVIRELKAEEGDAIALLPGWHNSTGAKAEVALALWGQLMILDALTFIPLHVRLIGTETGRNAGVMAVAA
jgi:hypothetical protein